MYVKSRNGCKLQTSLRANNTKYEYEYSSTAVPGCKEVYWLQVLACCINWLDMRAANKKQTAVCCVQVSYLGTRIYFLGYSSNRNEYVCCLHSVGLTLWGVLMSSLWTATLLCDLGYATISYLHFEYGYNIILCMPKDVNIVHHIIQQYSYEHSVWNCCICRLYWLWRPEY